MFHSRPFHVEFCRWSQFDQRIPCMMIELKMDFSYGNKIKNDNLSFFTF